MVTGAASFIYEIGWLRLLSLVASHADGEACVCDLQDALDAAQSRLSFHLKVLREAGLSEGWARAVADAAGCPLNEAGSQRGLGAGTGDGHGARGHHSGL